MRPRTLVVASLLAVTAACSGGSSFAQPAPRDFAPGACRDLAAPVLQLGKDLHGLGDKAPSTSKAAALTTAQGKVRSLQPHLPADLAPTVQQLVTAVGVLRLRNDTNSYDRSLRSQALAAYSALVVKCTPGGGGS